MSAGHNQPHLLFSVDGIKAFHIQDGREKPLNPEGAETLSLLMVPTSSPFADLSNTDPQSSAPEEDFYLHVHLPPDLDLPVPATTQIYHQGPTSYLIPRWDLGQESGAFTRIEFPKIGSGPGRVSQEDIDTFETILAQCTAFVERGSAPTAETLPPYNPADYKPGEGYIGRDSKRTKSQIVLIDEENGSIVGELGENFEVVEDGDVKPGSKRPVEIQLPAEGAGNKIYVSNISDDYLKMSRHPSYKNSSIVQNAAMASRFIVAGSSRLANAMASGAQSYTDRSKPTPKPMTFSPVTQERVRKLNAFTHGAVGLSASTVGMLGRQAQNLGATLARRGESKQGGKNGFDAQGRPISGYKPGLLNKSMIAFSTIADGIEQSAKELLNSGSAAASHVVGHKYGPEASQLAGNILGGAKNVGLVYVDAVGVTRKAVLKSVAKGMVVGRMPKGEHIIVGEGDGGRVPEAAVANADPESFYRDHKAQVPAVANNDLSVAASDDKSALPGYERVGFGPAADNTEVPTFGVIGEPLGSTGQDMLNVEKVKYQDE